jgi:hypothetical protein
MAGGTGAITVSVNAGVSWSATSSDPSWLTVTPAAGMSTGTATWTAAENPGVTTRTASLTVAGRTFPVTQTGTDVNLAPKSVEKAHGSDIVLVQVTALASTRWTVTPNASWISVIDSGNGFGDSTVTLAIGTNPSFLDRTGTVSIGSATFSILQAGTTNPVLDIFPEKASSDPKGSYGNIAVLATPDAPWSAMSLDPWIVIADGFSGAGNGNVSYVVSANPSLVERSGRIQINQSFQRPKIDLSWNLQTHVYSSSSDRSGWNRDLSDSLSRDFTGNNSVVLKGQDFRRANNSFTVAFRFRIAENNVIQRLFEAERGIGSKSTIYMDASNKICFRVDAEEIKSQIEVEKDQWNQVVLTVDDDNKVTLYVGEKENEKLVSISRKLGLAPFPSGYVKPSHIQVGRTSQPSSGNLLNGKINDFRIYSRAITESEAEALLKITNENQQYGDTSDRRIFGIAAEYNCRGQGLQTGGYASEIAHSSEIHPIYSSGMVNGNFPSTESILASIEIGGGFVDSVKGTGTGSGRIADWEVWASMFWRFRFVYVDGTTATTGESSQIAGGSKSTVEGNPFPRKPVHQVILLGRRTHGHDFPSHSAHIGSEQAYRAFASLNASILLSGIPGIANWTSGDDFVGFQGRALEGDQQSVFYFPNHNKIFKNQTGTYIIWFNAKKLPEGGVSRILRRSRNGTSDPSLAVSIDSGGDLICRVNGQDEKLDTNITTNEWKMLALSSIESGGFRVLLDGNEVGSFSHQSGYALGDSGASENLVIGGWIGGLSYLGFFDHLKSPSEVKGVFDSQKLKLAVHTVTQGVVDPGLAPQTAEVPAAGGTVSTELTVAQNVNWTASVGVPWLSLTSPESGAGSVTVVVQAAANPTVYERVGTVTVAGKVFTVTQAGLNVNVQHAETIFATDGGSAWVEVSPEGNGQWQAVSQVPWLTVAIGASGTGPGSVFIVADPYTNTSQSRTGAVVIAGRTVYFTQRGYTLSVSPQVAQVGSNAGAGEFGVAAPLTAVWEAIVTQPWITLIGSSNGLGSGVVRYSLAANTTGQPRTGRIIVSGTEYTITQLASLLVSVTSGQGGTAAGGGPYDVNAIAMLTATAAQGFVFSHWTGDAVGSANPLTLRVDSNKDVQANFVPAAATESFFNSGAQSVVGNPSAYGLFREDQFRAMAMGRPVLKVDPASGKGRIRIGVKQSDDLKSWSLLPVTGADVFVREGELEIEFSAPGNAGFYQLFGNEPGK